MSAEMFDSREAELYLEQEKQINVLIKERDELKAHCETYRLTLEILARLGNGANYGNSKGNEIAIRALQGTPQQSLAEIKAQVIKDFINEIDRLDHLNGWPCTYGAEDLEDIANQLREQAK
jgi:hypothetical protein